MSVRLSCPSCNTAFDLAAVPADRRATCPRCGDVFPIRGESAEHATGAPPAQPSPPPEPPRNRGWSIWRVAAVALALGALGFAVGLAVYYNRGTKPTNGPQPEPATVTATPPAQLSGLGYLPAECNVVFAVQPGPLLIQEWRDKQAPRAHDVLKKIGIPPQVFGALDSLGLTLQQIDHIAGGLFLPSGAEDVRVALALVLKQPLADEDDFLKKLKAAPAPGGKSRFTVELSKVPVAPVLARVSPTVWVFGLNPADLAAVDRGGFGPGGTQFRGNESEGFRKMLASVPPTAAVWIAADDDREWTEKPLVKLFAKSEEAKKWLPVASGGRGAVFALSSGEQPRMRLFVRTAETATADRVRAYFQARAAEMESASTGGGGVFAMFDAPYDPALLQRMLADAK